MAGQFIQLGYNKVPVAKEEFFVRNLLVKILVDWQTLTCPKDL